MYNFTANVTLKTDSIMQKIRILKCVFYSPKLRIINL